MKKVLRRAVAVIPAVALQILLYLLLFTWLKPWATGISIVLGVLSLLLVLYLMTKRDESTYRILWLVLVLTFPLPGALLYLILGNKRSMAPIRKRIARTPPLPPEEDASGPLFEELEREDRRLAQTLRRVQRQTGLPLRRGRETEYYPLGDDMFPRMLEELEKAEKFIFVEYLIIENGLFWDSLTEIMARKAAQGVDVRVMYDDLGSISTYTGKNAEELRKKGIQCVAFNPLLFVSGTLSCRTHRKMLIIDGKTAFSGGVNLADEYINHITRFGHWKDIGFMVRGEAARSFTRMFAEFWNAFTKDPVPVEYLSAPVDASDIRDGMVLPYYDSPLRPEGTTNELYIDFLAQAEDHAWFYTPYLLPGEALVDALVRAARRGVDVRIITPGIPDKKIVYRMTRSFYPVLMEAGVKIYEYTPGFLHAKACLVDGKVGAVGTVNLDYRSLFLQFENNTVFYKSSLLESLRADFLETQSKCRERKLDDLGITFWKWLVDGFLRLVAPLC